MCSDVDTTWICKYVIQSSDLIFSLLKTLPVCSTMW